MSDVPADEGRRLPTLTTRLVLAMTLVAAVATVATGLLAAPLLRGATETAAREPLKRQADLLATIPRSEQLVQRATRRAVRAQDLTLGVVTPTGATRGAALALTPAQVGRLRGGHPVSASATLDDVPVVLEARPTKQGGAVVIAGSVSSLQESAGELRRRVLLALAAGLVLALGVAVLVATRVSRPLARTADLARRMASGERGVELPEAGTREVGAVVDALGHLDQALSTSEARQREFLLSVSHELRTPLTAVRGLAEGLAEGVIPGSESREVGHTLVEESQRLERYVADLLALARLEADDFALVPGPVDAAELVRRAAEAWQDRAQRSGLTLLVEAPDSPVPLETDGARLRQVLDALTDNAVRVCPPGSIVVLAARPDLQGEPHVVLEVRDSGPGRPRAASASRSATPAPA